MQITTVMGPIDAHEAGVVLPHEHLLINLTTEFRGPGLLNNVEQAVAEVIAFGAQGGGTIVDVTPAELTDGACGISGTPPDENSYQKAQGTRALANVRALREMAQRAGVHVVAGTGHYREPYLDKEWFDRTSTDRIAELLVRDIEEGFPGTDVRAGVIGEIGQNRWYMTAAEERSFRAAARAHCRTGLTVTTHASRWPNGPGQVDLLLAEGVPPERIIVGHVDTILDPDYALDLAKRGVFVQLDLFCGCVAGGQVNEPELKQRLDMILKLSRHGYSDQVLLSHDVHFPAHWVSRGGGGFTYLLTEVPARLEELGFDRAELHHMMSANPQRALAG